MYNLKKIAFIDPFLEAKELVVKNQTLPMTQIGTGACFDVYLLETPTRKLVVKKWKLEEMQQEEASCMQKAYDDFQNALDEMGIAVAKTALYFQSLPNNKLSLWVFQEYFAPEELLEHILSKCSQPDIVDYFKRLISEIMKLANYNELNKTRIGIDIKPPNFSARDGSLILIDNFPFTQHLVQDRPRLPLILNLDIFSRDYSNLDNNLIALYVCFILYHGIGLKKELKQAIKDSLPEDIYKIYTRKARFTLMPYTWGKKLRVLYRLHLLKYHFYRILKQLKSGDS